MPRSRIRRGFALLAAMVLLALSAALAVGTFSLAQASRRAATAARARARVEGAVQRALGEVRAQWREELDSLAVGASVVVLVDTTLALDGAPLIRRASAARVAERLYAITVDVRGFEWEHPVVQRRGRLWLERADSTAALTPVTKWAFADLY